MAESQAGESMVTELNPVPVTPTGGNVINVTPGTIQSRRLLPIADLVTHSTIWLLESESNNVGSVKDPKDVKNLQNYKATLRRLWTRTVKFNRGGGDTRYEVTHPIAFPSMGELQSMPNTPLRQLAYLNWHLYRTLLEKQGSQMQVFIDEGAIEDISNGITEIEEFIDAEIGDGSPVADKPGVFNTGENWPDYSRCGVIKPTPMGGSVHITEPSTAAPVSVPPDTADVP